MNYWFIVLFVVLVTTILIVSHYFSSSAKIARRLKKSIYMPIKEFRDGDVYKVIGQVELASDFLIAPLSGRKCSYYSIEVEKRVQNGKNTSWRTIIEEEKISTILVKEQGYCAVLNSSQLKSYLISDANYKSGFMKDASSNLNSYLKAHGHDSVSFLGFNKTMRYSEGVLEEGETIALLGRGVWKNAEELGLPEEYDRVLAIEATAEEPVYLSDDPKVIELKFKD